MKILSYSPSIEAYVALGSGGSVLDISQDITRATVSRSSNLPSKFTIHLQNKNGKYDDIFNPMDRIKIYLTKTERHAITTGYITNVPKFTIYNSEVSISGFCSLYRLQQLYWDPMLVASQHLLGYEQIGMNYDGVIKGLLVNVAGYADDNVRIGQVPNEVIAWARNIYAAQQQELGQLKDMTDEFYEVLQTSGPSIGGGSGGSSDASVSGTLGSGTSIDIPSSLSQTGIIGDYTGYDIFFSKWTKNTNQRAVADAWSAEGKPWKFKIATLGGRFLIAMRPKFGTCGDKVDIVLDDGTVMNCTLADIKGSDATSEWGHVYGSSGVSLVEFEAQSGFRTADVPDAWRNKKVKSVTNCGRAI